jgi:hypothetical protein
MIQAERLARRSKLPHFLLPDGAIRFDWAEIEPLVKRVPARGPQGQEVDRE